MENPGRREGVGHHIQRQADRVLSATSEERLEESLEAVRRARAQAAVAAIQDASLRSGADRMSLEEINAEIDAARLARTK